MAHKIQPLEPSPLLLTSTDRNPRSAAKSAICRTQDNKQPRIYSVNKKDLNERIANELKKIGPSGLNRKSSQPIIQKERNLHTTSSVEYMHQEHQGNVTSDPEIKQRLDELTEKLQRIEERQKKQGSKSRSSIPNGDVGLSRQSRTIKINKNSVDVSRQVIKDLKIVKDEISELRLMMGEIHPSKGENMGNRKYSMKQGDYSEKPDSSTYTHSNMRLKKSEIYGPEIPSADQGQEEQKRTIYYNQKASKLSKSNLFGGDMPFQQQEIQPISSLSLEGKGKGKPRLSNKISSIPRGLSTKQFRVSKSTSKRQLEWQGYDEQPRKKCISQLSRYNKSPQPEFISAIEENFEQDDLDKKALILPKLPDGFNPILNSEELMNLAKELMASFNVESDYSEPINIKKYRNCVFFNHLQTNVLWHYDNKFYIGGWSEQGEGFKEGYGVESIPQKYMYEGQFHKGKRHGFGAMSSVNGEYYKGSWMNGYRHGQGKLQSSKGQIYDGSWVQGKKQGFGRIRLSKKQYYQGLLKAGQKQGLGKELFENGDIYQGEYKNGKFDGSGVYKWAHGAFYDGQFVDGRRQGKGTWVSSKSKKADIYQGQYEKDKKSGRGKYKWGNNSIYIGGFLNDLKNGEGTIYYNDGKILNGIWEEDELVKKLYSEKSKVNKIKR